MCVLSPAVSPQAYDQRTGTLKILARHPEFQRQLHAYLTTHLAPLEDRLPSYEDVTAEALPLLEATAHELIRLSRPTDGAAREAMVDTQILGHAIPKGTLMVVTGGTTYDETRSSLNVSSEELRQRRGCDAWTDDRPADELYPERWLDEQGKFDAKAGPFFNFSAGLRGCFGRSIAVRFPPHFMPFLDGDDDRSIDSRAQAVPRHPLDVLLL